MRCSHSANSGGASVGGRISSVGTAAPSGLSSPPTTSTDPLPMTMADGYHLPSCSLTVSTSSSQSLVPLAPSTPSGV
jgi:hypothetical protein